MQNSMGLVWGIIIAIVLIGGGYYLWSNSQGTTPVPGGATSTTSTSGNTSGSQATSTVGTTPTSTAQMSATVSYNGSSFSPKTVTIKKGGTVTWTNDSSANMWVASAQHPTHTLYAGTTRQEHCPDTSGQAFDQCAGSANDYSFKFDKVGSWNYHDHINASVFGTVVVVE